MPVVRNVVARRRSRRLSKQPPQNGVDWEGCEYTYPDIERDDAVHEPPASIDTSLLSSKSQFTDELLSACPAVASLYAERAGRPSPFQTTAHGRRHKEGHVPRPPNAFMIFRSHFWSKQKVTKTTEKDHRHISRIAGLVWNELSDLDRLPYRKVADEVKRIHAELHPDYKYSPVYRREKAPKRRVNRDAEEDEERCKKVASLIMSGVEGDALEERMKVGDEENLHARHARPARPARRARRSSVKKSKRVVRVKREEPPSPSVAATPLLSSTPMFATSALIQMSPEDSAFCSPMTSSTPLGPPKASASSLAYDEFVPMDDIPVLDLSAPAAPAVEVKEDPKQDEQPLLPAEGLRPDHLMSDYVDPVFSRSDAQAIVLQPGPDFSPSVVDPEEFPYLSHLYQPAPESDAYYSPFDNSSVTFSNPFAESSLRPAQDDDELFAAVEQEEKKQKEEPPLDESQMSTPQLASLWLNIGDDDDDDEEEEED
ncbi:hypothetical protein DENSPDRAFT_833677 [Dentipellis sp. KUC8613]|nr:hypothetical protein DENSPDRAFT_833677 [Dentipellis sp. KUC8613]